VVGVLVYGWINLNLTPVATVNGEAITTEDFQGRVRLAMAEMIQQAAFSGDVGDLPQQLADEQAIGQRVLDQMIDDRLIRQEAEAKGIVVTEQEIDRAIAEAFGYFPQGTPTPVPSFTPNPTIEALASIIPSPTSGPSPTPSPTATSGPSPTHTSTPPPRPTATPYTREAYEQVYAGTLDRLARLYGVKEGDFRSQFVAQLYRRRLFDSFEDQVPREQEHVKARHILVEDEATAQEVLDQLEAGEPWEDLALEYSTDETNRDRGGDLGWFPRGRMDPAFEQAAFEGEVGEVVGPVESSFGWHLIEVLDREVRPMEEFAYQLAVQRAFSEWLTSERVEAEIQISSNWDARVPGPPDLAEILQQP
jgi:parvulin-like peptidyl-prolyl isomerase